MTREEAIENHRKMWNWIADETEKREKIVFKEDYFIEHNLNRCISACYCCQYVYVHDNHIKWFAQCNLCPIEWGVKTNDRPCLDKNSPFSKFQDTCSDDYKNAAKYAREIANLPERKIK